MITRPLRVLILGVNGFIGSHLTETILSETNWEVYGMDLANDKVPHVLGNCRFHFMEGDITINREWIEYHVRKCDVVIPLVAIANPIQYVQEPLKVFELDFEANLWVVRQCVKWKKRIIFPSTSEVYGNSPDAELCEESSPLVYGPIEKQRWIYACSKQLLDRVIYAYGVRDGLDYTLFRPFNWIGPRLDDMREPKEGNSRLFTQFLANVIHRKPLQLVDGGKQRRSFTYVGDGVAALLKIIANENGCASRQIFNLGNPANDLSVRQLAKLMIKVCKAYPPLRERAETARIVEVSSEAYFGKYYQDIHRRVPSIDNAQKRLGWNPTLNVAECIARTVTYALEHDTFA